VGIIDRIRDLGRTKVAAVQLMTEQSGGFYGWDGKLYRSDVVRSAIRPYVTAIGKLIPKEIYETEKNGKRVLEINPDAYIRFLLEEPNPYMCGQVFRERLASQLIINGNAFALILRDEAGLPQTMLPINAVSVRARYAENGALWHEFQMMNGKVFTFPDLDVIHLRRDYYEDDAYGSPIAPALTQLMEIVTTTDQGIVKAVKNSAVIRWLMKFVKPMKEDDLEKRANEFAQSFLRTENGTGVAAVDSTVDAKEVSGHEYVPNAAQMDRTTQRIYALLNTNEKIVTSAYTENEWNAYFDAQIEPVLLQLNAEFTRKLFTRRERAFGNRIVFEASAWDSASLTTKLALVAMVDRGALLPDEWRATFNLGPIEGGDKPIRRLDTAQVTEGSDGNGE
jgi:HK97 family phage portal protein